MFSRDIYEFTHAHATRNFVFEVQSRVARTECAYKTATHYNIVYLRAIHAAE